MGFFNRLAFWKKEDDFSDLDFGSAKDDLGMGGMPASTGEQQAGTGFPTGDIGQQSERPDIADFGSQQQQSPSMPSALSDLGASTPMQVIPPEGGLDNYKISKEIELVSSKIDALKAAVDSMNQRLANLEKMAQSEQESSKGKSW